jgi:hypothetical protein
MHSEFYIKDAVLLGHLLFPFFRTDSLCDFLFSKMADPAVNP